MGAGNRLEGGEQYGVAQRVPLEADPSVHMDWLLTSDAPACLLG
jgi:hypothetical protein